MLHATHLIVGIVLTTVAATTGIQGPLPVTVTRDIVYGTAGGVALKLDLARPESSDGPLPALVFIHGGGWQLGDKADFEPMIQQFATFGYVAVSVGYRLAPEYPWPAQIEDVKCAIRYLRANAAEHGIDPERIAAAGHSAGGHLALLTGFMRPEDGYEGDGGHPGVSSSVQAVVNVCGPTDLRVWRASPESQAEAKEATGKDFEEVLADFAGTADRNAPVIAEASPITYITEAAPPVLTFHGSIDPVVPVEQATLLHEALDEAGVQHHKLVILEGADHGFGEAMHLIRILSGSLRFADKWLKGITTGNAVQTVTE